VGDLYEGACRSSAAARHLDDVEKRVQPAVTVLSCDVVAARVYGQVRARLDSAGRPLADADLQIAATAILHDLEMVTGDVKHFRCAVSLVPAKLRSQPRFVSVPLFGRFVALARRLGTDNLALATEASIRNASLTASAFGKTSDTSGSRTTTFVLAL